ncbi:MAG: ATP-dependent 6-phosphofructokinase [Fastidiosipilaceae bacterium]|jgi:6-phosphofructokinase 1
MTDVIKHGLAPWSEEGGVQTVCVLTSGGDAPGMNAAIRAVVRAGLHAGYRMLGCRRGYHGLWRGDIVELDGRSVSERLQRGGTFLMTARSHTFSTPEGVQKAFDMCRVFAIDALVVIGGDGSLRGALDLARMGLPVIGIPGTIDNDIGCSEYTIGYDTAMNTAMTAIDKLRDTASSHERCSCIEVMGRRAGYIALNVGMSCGAEVILVPEVEMDFDKHVVRRLLECRNMDKHHYIVVVAEGAGDTVEISNRIEAQTGIESRVTILGHLQRGGSPSIQDRMMASQMGALAVKSLIAGEYGRVVAYQQGRVTTIEIEEALQMTKTISREEIDTAYNIAL